MAYPLYQTWHETGTRSRRLVCDRSFRGARSPWGESVLPARKGGQRMREDCPWPEPELPGAPALDLVAKAVRDHRR